METSIDSAGRIVVPKPLRDALGLVPGTTLEVSSYGAGLTLIARGPTARLIKENGHLLADSKRTVTDEEVSSLIDAGRR